MMHVSFAPLKLQMFNRKPIFCTPLPLQHWWVWFVVGFRYYDDRSGSRRGQEGMFQTEADREREECDSD